MLSLNKIIRYDYGKCQQCGTCEAVCPKQAISLCRLENGLCAINVDSELCIKCKKCITVCPAIMDTVEDADYLQKLKDKTYFFGYNTDNEIRHDCSSGGVCKTIIIEGLKSGLVDGVYSLQKTNDYPYAEGAFYTSENIPTYQDLPNSVYHSLMIGRNVGQIEHCKRLMIVGTSCQLRSLEKAVKGKCDELIKVCLFCKQQKTLDSTRFLAKAMGTAISGDIRFTVQYRGKGWPGMVIVNNAELPWHRAAQLPFGRRLWTVPGCNVCGDPFGMECNADITLMDPWNIRTSNNLGETLITIHTNSGLDLINNIPNLTLEHKDYDDIEPALGLADIWRKRMLVPYFREEKCNDRIIKAGNAEQRQRRWLQYIVMKLPRMPFIVYRLLCHLPDLRNKILKY